MRKLLSEKKLGEIYSKFGIFIILIAIIIISSFASPYFLTTGNLTNILKQIAVVAILALSATYIIILGHINVSYGAVIALIGSFSCQVMVATGNLLVSLLAALAMGAFIGAINGFIITTFEIPAFIMTLATTAIARGAVLLMTGGIPVTGMGESFLLIGQGMIFTNLKIPIPISVLILIGLTIISWIILSKTCFGRYVYAVGGNEKAAIASGIKTKTVIRKAFILDGVLTAIAGVLFVSRMNSGQPGAGVGYEFYAITAVVVGGTSLAGGVGTIMGTIVGALIVGIINNIQILLHVHTYWQQIVQGLIILFAVIIDILSKKASGKR
ncbi:MAG TPA: ribose ABC transporter permease [Lachnospiraceae bacterium]|jgi:inositol transport system permease protein|nr:ribose ABC transporter permease [Lachnospiraceae bacterium]HBR02587.1 ribose ABC transporter permease [Ruminiclostridium sp.]